LKKNRHIVAATKCKIYRLVPTLHTFPVAVKSRCCWCHIPPPFLYIVYMFF